MPQTIVYLDCLHDLGQVHYMGMVKKIMANCFLKKIPEIQNQVYSVRS